MAQIYLFSICLCLINDKWEHSNQRFRLLLVVSPAQERGWLIRNGFCPYMVKIMISDDGWSSKLWGAFNLLIVFNLLLSGVLRHSLDGLFYYFRFKKHKLCLSYAYGDLDMRENLC